MKNFGDMFKCADTLEQLYTGVKNLPDKFKGENVGIFVYCKENNRLYLVWSGEVVPVYPARRKIMELKCKNCGQPMTTSEYSSLVKCEYCGSVYDIDNWEM